jgi:hypothetical protein
MNIEQAFVCGIAFSLGTLCLAVAVLDLNWFFRLPKARWVDERWGRPAARLGFALIGILLVLLGVYIAVRSSLRQPAGYGIPARTYDGPSGPSQVGPEGPTYWSMNSCEPPYSPRAAVIRLINGLHTATPYNIGYRGAEKDLWQLERLNDAREMPSKSGNNGNSTQRSPTGQLTAPNRGNNP